MNVTAAPLLNQQQIEIMPRNRAHGMNGQMGFAAHLAKARSGEPGAIGSEVSKLDADTKEEVVAFMKNVRNAMRSGQFDAKSLAEQAPEEIKGILEEKGIDLEDALTSINEHVSHIRNRLNDGSILGGGLGMAQTPTDEPIWAELFQSLSTGDEEE